MAIRRRIDVDVYSHPEQFIAGMGAATASAATFGNELGAVAAKSVASTGATEIAAAGVSAGEVAGAGFLGKFESSLQTGFSRLGKTALTDAGAAIGGETGATFASSFGTAAGSGLSAVLPVLIGVFAAYEVGKTAFHFADDAAQYEESVRRLKLVTGDSAQGASLLIGQLNQLGISSDSISRPITQLAKNIESGGGALKNFFSQEELAQLRHQDLAKTIGDVASRYQSLADPVERDALAVAAFGNRGVSALLPLLNATDAQRNAFDNLTRSAGLIFNDQQLNQAHEFEISQRQLGLTWKGLEVDIGNVLIPVITSLLTDLDSLIQKAENAGSAIDSAVGSKSKWFNIPEAFHLLGRAAEDLFPDPGKGLRKGADDSTSSAKNLGAALDAAKQSDDAFTQSLNETAAAEQAVATGADAIIKSIDPLKSFSIPDPTAAAQKLTDATDRLTAAKDSLASAQARVDENERYVVRTPERDAQLAAARRDLAKATGEVHKAENDAAAAKKSTDTASTVEKDYTDEVSKMQRFVKELDDAAKKGVDPAFLQKAIADPDKYLPILDALEHDTKGSLESTINTSEGQLREIGTRLEGASEAVGESVAEAVQGGASKLTGDLATVFHKALTDPASDIYQLAITIGQSIKQGVITGATNNSTSLTSGSTTGYTSGDLSATSNIDYQGPSKPSGFDKYYRSPGDPGYGSDNPPFKNHNNELDWEYYKQHGGHYHPSEWWKYGPVDISDKDYKEPYPLQRAQGGIDAHIAYGQSYIYAEPGTGGEAFIPLGASNRGRSTMILAQVADMFGLGLHGMASGGIGGAFADSTTNYNTRNQQIFNGDIRVHDPREFERWADRRSRLNALMGSN